MDKCKKCSLLDELVKPLGYCYNCNYGFFSSTLDAWQKKAGYTYLYDRMAPRFQMVFDSLPIYFDYNGRTWLIEFWKGQYGIHTGAEIGIYHADRIISPEHYKTTLFESINEEEMLICSFLLYNRKGDYFRVTNRHWWITAFFTGCFSRPSDLCMENSIIFPNVEMLSAFMDGLYQAGYSTKNIDVCGLRLTFTFCESNETYHFLTRLRCRFSQWKNRIFCKLYLFITRPFCDTEDRILYLYYYLPFIFRKTLRLRRFNKRCHRKKRCMKSRRKLL